MPSDERYRSSKSEKHAELYQIRRLIEVDGLEQEAAVWRLIRKRNLDPPKRHYERLRRAFRRAKKKGTLPTGPPVPEFQERGVKNIFANERRALEEAERSLEPAAEKLRRLGIDPADPELGSLVESIKAELKEMQEFLAGHADRLVPSLREKGFFEEEEILSELKRLHGEEDRLEERRVAVYDFFWARDSISALRDRLSPVTGQGNSNSGTVSKKDGTKSVNIEEERDKSSFSSGTRR